MQQLEQSNGSPVLSSDGYCHLEFIATEAVLMAGGKENVVLSASGATITMTGGNGSWISSNRYYRKSPWIRNGKETPGQSGLSSLHRFVRTTPILHRLIRSTLPPKNQRGIHKAPIISFTCLTKSDEGPVRYTIFGGIAGRASAKPGNPRFSDARWMLDLRFAMFDRKAGLGQAG